MYDMTCKNLSTHTSREVAALAAVVETAQQVGQQVLVLVEQEQEEGGWRQDGEALCSGNRGE
jgi:hypothetical protein